jgi:hypothetical protein
MIMSKAKRFYDYLRNDRLNEAEDILRNISLGNQDDWQTTAALRYFGWTWDAEGKAIGPEDS